MGLSVGARVFIVGAVLLAVLVVCDLIQHMIVGARGERVKNTWARCVAGGVLLTVSVVLMAIGFVVELT